MLETSLMNIYFLHMVTVSMFNILDVLSMDLNSTCEFLHHFFPSGVILVDSGFLMKVLLVAWVHLLIVPEER